MNVVYWFVLAPIVALDGYISMRNIQTWLPYVSCFLLSEIGIIDRPLSDGLPSFEYGKSGTQSSKN